MEEKIMTMGDWILTLILTSIPVVGLIMLIVWSLSSSTNANKRNYARAALILMIIGIVLSVIFGGCSMLLGIAGMSSY
jgi:uncharacterized membrane protein YqjE